MFNAIIVDDEAKSCKLLANLVKQYCPDIKIKGLANTVAEALPLIHKEQPEILFLDIQLNGQDGFNLLDEIPDKQFQVIFTTAYEQYAHKAFRYDAQDYLLKPIHIDELQSAVEKDSLGHHSEMPCVHTVRMR